MARTAAQTAVKALAVARYRAAAAGADPVASSPSKRSDGRGSNWLPSARFGPSGGLANWRRSRRRVGGQRAAAVGSYCPRPVPRREGCVHPDARAPEPSCGEPDPDRHPGDRYRGPAGRDRVDQEAARTVGRLPRPSGTFGSRVQDQPAACCHPVGCPSRRGRHYCSPPGVPSDVGRSPLGTRRCRNPLGEAPGGEHKLAPRQCAARKTLRGLPGLRSEPALPSRAPPSRARVDRNLALPYKRVESPAGGGDVVRRRTGKPAEPQLAGGL